MTFEEEAPAEAPVFPDEYRQVLLEFLAQKCFDERARHASGSLPNGFTDSLGLDHPAFTLMNINLGSVQSKQRAMKREKAKQQAAQQARERRASTDGEPSQQQPVSQQQPDGDESKEEYRSTRHYLSIFNT